VLVFSTFSSALAFIEPDCETWKEIEMYKKMWAHLANVNHVAFREGEPSEKGPPHFNYVMIDEKRAHPVYRSGLPAKDMIFDATVDFFDPRYDPDFMNDNYWKFRKFEGSDGKMTHMKLRLTEVVFHDFVYTKYGYKGKGDKIWLIFVTPVEDSFEKKLGFQTNRKIGRIWLPLNRLSLKEREYVRTWVINHHCSSQMVTAERMGNFKYVKTKKLNEVYDGRYYNPVNKDGVVLDFLWLNPYWGVDPSFDPDFEFRQEYTFTHKDGRKLFGCYEGNSERGAFTHIKTLEGPIIRVPTDRLIDDDLVHVNLIEKQKLIWKSMMRK